MPPHSKEEEKFRLSIEFSRSLLSKIDEVRNSWGLRSRGATIERMLQELLEEEQTEDQEEEQTGQVL